MVLFPEARRALERAAGEPSAASGDVSIEDSRAEARRTALAEAREEVAEVRDLDADGVPCRLYRPQAPTGNDRPVPGSWCTCTVAVSSSTTSTSTTQPCARLANRCGIPVLSVDYRRPPEHRFPAAPDDVSTVLAWLEAHATDESLPGPVFAHGDSAGGNLALVAALRHPGRLRAIALVYPFLDPTAGFDSYRTAADGFDPAEAAWYWQQYAATDADLTDPDLAPLLSDRLGTLPPTLVVTAEHDPLRDEGEHLALLLAEAGVEVVSTRYQGQVHGFWRHVDVFPAAEALTRQVAGFVRMHG